MMNKNTRLRTFGALLLLWVGTFTAQAQIDTINAANGRLRTQHLKSANQRYFVYFTDSTETKLLAAELWYRNLLIAPDANGKAQYTLDWDYYGKDTLTMRNRHTGSAATMAPLTYYSDAKKRGIHSYAFSSNAVSVPDADKTKVKDPDYRFTMTPYGFDFSLDLEILPLLPFKKVGQKFAIAFYQPGSPDSKYYTATVLRKEKLALPGGGRSKCWVLELDYGRPTSKAIFWISEETHQVIKMRETFRSFVRYKVLVY
jgi:hypothetical protein